MWSKLKTCFTADNADKQATKAPPKQQHGPSQTQPYPVISVRQPLSGITAELSRSNTMLIKVVHDYQQLLGLMCTEAFRAHHAEESRAVDTRELVHQNTLVYVLQLQQHKYYVGKTKRLLQRYEEHESGRGAVWTQKYKPVRIVATYPCLVPGMENAVVKLYMAKKGIPNVRGGAYANDELNAEQLRCLELELRHDFEKCYACGKAGHYARNCSTSLPREPGLPTPASSAAAAAAAAATRGESRNEEKEDEELYFFK